MKIDHTKLLIALGDQVYAALQLALLACPANSELGPYQEKVIFPLTEVLDDLRVLTKRDVSNN